MAYAPIIKTLDVPCSQEEAFTVFVHEMHTWWPLTKFSASVKYGKVPLGLMVEPRVGGSIVETGADGSEHLWGTITRYEPHACVAMDFHIGLPKHTASLVEVDFHVVEAELTRVRLVQSEWERFGEYAENMRNGYPKGWRVIFDQAYAEACGGRPATPPAG